MISAGIYATRAEEADADFLMDRMYELTHTFPFYGERRAEEIARKELEELKDDD